MRFLDRRLMDLTRARAAGFGLVVGLGLGAGVATVAQARLLAGIVSRVFLDGQDRKAVAGLLVMLFVSIVLRAVLVAFERAAANDFASRSVEALRRQVLTRVTELGPEQLARTAPGEIQALMTDGLDEVHQWFSDYLPQVALSALVPALLAIAIMFSDWFSALVLLITAPVIPVFMVLIGSLADTRARRQMFAFGRMAAVFLGLIQGIATLKVLGRVNDKLEVIRAISEDYRHHTMSVLRVAFLSALVLELVTTLSTAVVAVEVALRLLYGRLAFEEAFFVLLLAPEFYLPLRLLGQRFHAGTAGVRAAGRIFKVLAKTGSPGGTRVYGSSVMPEHTPIEICGVYYTYPDQTRELVARPTLQGVDLVLVPGEILALVGPSGAGKSTLAKLVLRFIEAQEGSLRAGKIDANEINIDAWRSKLAWVPQKPYLLADTIENNIRIANETASDAQLRRAIRLARAEAFIDDQPQGWQTMIGEGGIKVSSGQAQRLALARAFVRDAPFLILDEPGAGLDPRTLFDLDAAIAEFAADRTVLVIAHRLATAERADRVAVMENGRIVQLGPPKGLALQDGPYRRMLESRDSLQ